METGAAAWATKPMFCLEGRSARASGTAATGVHEGPPPLFGDGHGGLSPRAFRVALGYPPGHFRAVGVGVLATVPPVPALDNRYAPTGSGSPDGFGPESGGFFTGAGGMERSLKKRGPRVAAAIRSSGNLGVRSEYKSPFAS